MCLCTCIPDLARSLVELHQTCEDIFDLRGQQSRPRKFDLRLVANYAH